MEQKLIHGAGVEDKVGWAFGIGMERLAMMLYKIPDIRCFWSEDSAFINQFVTDDIDAKIVYRVSIIYHLIAIVQILIILSTY